MEFKLELEKLAGRRRQRLGKVYAGLERPFGEQTFSDSVGEWAVSTLSNFASEKPLQEFCTEELAEIAFQRSSEEGFDETPGSPEFIERAKASDLNYPIIVVQYPDGKFVADGNHRLWKAKEILGKDTISGYLISEDELHALPTTKSEPVESLSADDGADQDDEYMSIQNARGAADKMEHILDCLEGMEDDGEVLEDWASDKLSKLTSDVESLYNYLKYGKEE